MVGLAEILGESPGIVAVRETVGRLLQRQADARRLPPVLIQGETGTGKGLVARALHRAGPRRDGPFVDVNCAAIPEPLLEAEMFGFERGAFTDARQAKPGLVQTAHKGLIFLDEVGLLPFGLQSKLLKFVEDRTVRRSAARGVSRWTCGSSPPVTRISVQQRVRVASAKTSIIGSRSSRSGCRHCASAGTISRYSPSISSTGSVATTVFRRRASPPTVVELSLHTHGPGMSAS